MYHEQCVDWPQNKNEVGSVMEMIFLSTQCFPVFPSVALRQFRGGGGSGGLTTLHLRNTYVTNCYKGPWTLVDSLERVMFWN
jgi:hypothetical protein